MAQLRDVYLMMADNKEGCQELEVDEDG